MTPRARPVPPLLAAAPLGLAACGGDTAEPAAPVVIEGGVIEGVVIEGVVIRGHAFPALTAAPGGTLTVTNTDAEPHTVGADDGSFATEAPHSSAPGTPVAPAEPGTYPAHCEIHPSVRGVPTVRWSPRTGDTMPTLRTALRATACLAALAALAACGGGSEQAPPPAAAPSSGSAAHDGAHAGGAVTGSLDAADQTGDGQSVTIASVEIQSPNGGWIALHQDADGEPGPVEHVVAVPPGTSTDVVLPTPGGIATGAYWPMLHVDEGVAGTYEFPGADVPVTDGDQVVMKRIMVTVS